jgi:hypothetical protein
MKFLALVLGFAASSSWADRAECFPQNRPDCEIGIIYLHGLIPPGGTNPLEAGNRRYLRNLVTRLNAESKGKKCIRVAFPISPIKRTTKFGTNFGWSRPSYSKSGEQIKDTAEFSARKACAGSALSAQLMVVGYSNGANAVAEMEKDLSCKELNRFAVMTAIGPDGLSDLKTRAKLSNPKNPKSKPCNKFFANNYHSVGVAGSSSLFGRENTAFLLNHQDKQTAEAAPAGDGGPAEKTAD